jgi:formamidopyrimidine-DNA glycosylase
MLHSSPLMIEPRSSRRLVGRRIGTIDRHGKWMFLRTDGRDVLVVHLGMTGWIGVLPKEADVAPHTHVRAVLDEPDRELRFVDPRRFGEWTLMGAAEWQSRFGPKRLGPDALSCNLEELQARLQRTARSIKPTLLDQRVVAGVGNIYADEILHQARLAPTRPALDLQPEETVRLHVAMLAVLRSSICDGGTTIHSFVGSDGEEGRFQARLRVYGRAGRACSNCETLIRCNPAVVAGRSTYWCPGCQPARKSRRIGRSKARHVISHD